MKKLLLLALLTIGFGKAYAQVPDLYDMTAVPVIKIYFGFSNWDYRMDTANAATESYTLADSIVVNGVRFDSCGVRYKGNSSYSVNRAKNPLHIKLDFIKDQSYPGVDYPIVDLKLANGFSDPTMVREVTSYAILRKYMDAPKSTTAKVYINGNYYGVMTLDEDIDNPFLMKHYYGSSNTFVKCNPKNAGPGSGSGSSLLYLGTSQTSYVNLYELKSDTGWNDLISMTNTLNNNFANFSNIADVDRFLWMLAFNNVLVNLDSYSGAFRQNYYLYKDHNGRWIPTVWDLNMSFAGFTQTGSTSLSSTTAPTMAPDLHINDASWPLIKQLLSNPTYKRMYLAHMRTINNENFVNGSYKTITQAHKTLIAPAVAADANFLFTQTQFQNALTTNQTGGMGSIAPHLLMDSRATYLANHALLSPPGPSISGITVSPTSPAFASTITVSALVTNATSTAVWLGYRLKKSDPFVRVVMYDDGQHGDGVAGDNVFGASFQANGIDIQYYIYAENVNSGMFSPERAEHEFYSITTTIQQASTTDVVINEFVADNTTGIYNERGKHADWIELFNTTSSPLGLKNLCLSDDATNPTKWKFPADSWIPANGYLVVWADDYDSTYQNIHTSFNLASTGGTVILASSAGPILSNTTYPALLTDKSYGRCVNGSGTFTNNTIPTPRLTNACPSATNTVVGSAVKVYPNPSSDRVYIDYSDGSTPKMVAMFNSLGEHVNVELQGNAVDISSLAEGMYILRVTDYLGKTSTFRIIRQ